MRQWAAGMAVVVLASGCAPADTPVDPGSVMATSQPRGLDPDRLNRLRGGFPPGYEVGVADGVGSPTTFWGLRDQWSAEPGSCSVLIVAGIPASARGLSASGPGGTIYLAVVGGTVAPPVPPAADCDRWTMTNAHSVATVSAAAAPPIDGVQTTGLTATIRTVVESGTETDAATHTYTAYLADQAVFVTLVTDPGALGAPLPAQFAADLLVSATAALRG